jgi:hypothetical protein
VLGCVASDDISPLNTLTKTVTANFLVEKPIGKDVQIVKEIGNLAATAMEAIQPENDDRIQSLRTGVLINEHDTRRR